MMATKDVKENRHLYIGGSDIAKVMGLSRWGTPLSLWAEKTGKIPPKDLSNVEAVELGNDLEDFVANSLFIPLGSLVVVLFCVSKKAWGWERFTAEANTGKGLKVQRWMRWYMIYVLPVIILVVFVLGMYQKFK